MRSRFFKYKYWIDWIFPNRCPICDGVIRWNELVCTKCEEKLPFLENMSVVKGGNDIELSCAVFSYEGNVYDGIYRLKSDNGVNLAEYASEYLSEFLESKDVATEIDLITCVPMARKKVISRGYNQAEIIAGFMSKSLKKPFDCKLLKRRNNKVEQHKLNSKERRKNAYEAYHINSRHRDVKGKNILICDDVITTGATIERCAGLLKSMGASKIFAAAICSTVSEKNTTGK